MKINKILLGIGAVLVTFVLYAFCVSFFLSVKGARIGEGTIEKPIEKVVEKKLTITKTEVQDTLDFNLMIANCVNSGAITITRPIDDEDALAKFAKECEKRITNKATKVREGGKSYQELLSLIK